MNKIQLMSDVASVNPMRNFFGGEQGNSTVQQSNSFNARMRGPLYCHHPYPTKQIEVREQMMSMEFLAFMENEVPVVGAEEVTAELEEPP